MTVDMTKALDSMEEAIKLRSAAAARRRSEEMEQEQREFLEKLRQAAGTMEIDAMQSGIQGKKAAIQRDQLMQMMMAGF